MRIFFNLRIGLVFAMICLVVGLMARVEAKQAKSGGAMKVGSSDIGGVVTSSKGPEAGVWVIAETTDLPTKFVKIVVTDDQGRYMLPELPQAKYQVWVRGYGLVDSTAIEGTPGKQINLTAAIAPSPKEAAKYYPAVYWLSLIKVPDKSEFPMKATPMPEFQGQRAAAAAPSASPAAQREGGMGQGQPREAARNEEDLAAVPILTQGQWIDVMKQGCQQCHQIGDLMTRDLSHLSRYNFKSSEEAWATRIHFGQAGAQRISGTLPRFADQQRAIKMYADWTDRIAAGEVPPAPPRPEGIERNVVVSVWDWGLPSGHPHDEISTDKRNPRINANGPVYGADYNDDDLLYLDPTKNAVGAIPTPYISEADKAKMNPTWSQKLQLPSPIYGSQLLWQGVGGPHSLMMDEKQRVWVTTSVRPSANPAYCKAGSDNVFAKYFPQPTSGKQAAVYDPETKKFTPVDTCFGTHHVTFGYDKDNTVFFSNPGGQAFGWINTKVFDATGSSEKAQGWCPAYLDTNGDGKIDPTVDKRIGMNGYGISVNPLDNSIWMAVTSPMPGHLLRMTLGSNPPSTCMAEVYEPPFDNPKAPGVVAYTPRGIDIDRSNGVVWTALSGNAPGPKMGGVTDAGSADFEYYNWVDEYNTHSA